MLMISLSIFNRYFVMHDMGIMCQFLGIEFTYHPSKLILSQGKYNLNHNLRQWRLNLRSMMKILTMLDVYDYWMRWFLLHPLTFISCMMLVSSIIIGRNLVKCIGRLPYDLSHTFKDLRQRTHLHAS